MTIDLYDDVTYEIAPYSDEAYSPNRNAGEPRGVIMLVYFVVDVSGSMKDVTAELNKGLANLLGTLESQPMLASKVRFSVITFNNRADVALPMSDLREVETINQLAASGGTCYSAAFRLLKAQIEADVRALKEQFYDVYRPSVFFLSDGCPNHSDYDWENALSDLTSTTFSAHPNIIAAGMGDVDARTIAKVASRKDFALLHTSGGDLGQAVTQFMESLTHSIVYSVPSVIQGKPLQIEKPAGFITIDADVI